MRVEYSLYTHGALFPSAWEIAPVVVANCVRGRALPTLFAYAARALHSGTKPC